jgi:hypothetical protein
LSEDNGSKTEKITNLEDTLRDVLEQAAEDGVTPAEAAEALERASELLLAESLKNSDGETMTADEAVKMMINQSLELALDKFIEGLAEDASLISVAELILEEGHSYNLSKETKNNAAVVSNLRKALIAL